MEHKELKEKGFPLSYAPKAAVKYEAPDFKAMCYHDFDFREITLSEYRGKYVLLFFWPLDFTFVCPTEIIAFADAAKAFRENGCEIIGCSADSQYVHMEYCMKPRKKGGLGDMDIPLIADTSHEIAQSFGCMIDKGKHKGLALRATYIIDKEGVIRHMSMNDIAVGRNVDEYLRLVQAFQYVDEHGEVCPAQWKPGQDTIIPNAKSDKNKSYWENVHDKK